MCRIKIAHLMSGQFYSLKKICFSDAFYNLTQWFFILAKNTKKNT